MKKLQKLLIISIMCLCLSLKANGQIPTNTTATIQLAWNPSPQGYPSYILYQGTNSLIYYTNYNTGNNTILTISNLTRGLTYYFNVVATNNGFSSPYAGEISYTVLNWPAAPTNLRIIILNP